MLARFPLLRWAGCWVLVRLEDCERDDVEVDTVAMGEEGSHGCTRPLPEPPPASDPVEVTAGGIPSGKLSFARNPRNRMAAACADHGMN